MSDGLRDTLRGSPISWSALIALVLAVIAGVYGYGGLNHRVQVLEDLQPVMVTTKLAVIEANQIRSAADIAQIQKDVRQILNSDWRGARP